MWTDGACSGNPGPGGWAAIVVAPGGGEPVELTGGAPHTTNNRMEYTAALHGLRSLPPGSRVCIVTDSRLLLDSMTRWIAGWKRKGWRTAGGDPVKNQDLVQALDREIGRHAAVRWHWVRGHETGARARAQGAQRPRRPPRGGRRARRRLSPGPHAGTSAGNPARRRLTARRAGN